MSNNYVLVHGAGVGNWIWDGVTQALARQRIRPRFSKVVHGSHTRSTNTNNVKQVIVGDLPGHGYRQGENFATISMEDYVEAVLDWIPPGNRKDVILVGHDIAGLILPQVANRIPHRIKRMVFLSAFVPQESPVLLERLLMVNAFISDSEKTAMGNLPMTRRVPFLLRALIKMEDKQGVKPFHKALSKELLCNGLESGPAGAVIARMTAYPFWPMVTPTAINGFSETPSTYVVFTKDRLLPPSTQRRMSKVLGDVEMVEMNGGHISGIVMRAPEIAELLLNYT